MSIAPHHIIIHVSQWLQKIIPFGINGARLPSHGALATYRDEILGMVTQTIDTFLSRLSMENWGLLQKGTLAKRHPAKRHPAKRHPLAIKAPHKFFG